MRLHLQAALSYNEVSRALKISKSVVGKYVSLARLRGVDWALAQTLTDEELEARLYRPALPRSSYQLTPDFAAVHQELKRAGVTLQLLWEEYAGANELAYKSTRFCVKCRRAWAPVSYTHLDVYKRQVQAKAARLLRLTPRQMGYALQKNRIEVRKF